VVDFDLLPLPAAQIALAAVVRFVVLRGAINVLEVALMVGGRVRTVRGAQDERGRPASRAEEQAAGESPQFVRADYWGLSRPVSSGSHDFISFARPPPVPTSAKLPASNTVHLAAGRDLPADLQK
jgi:hypothetical protein